MWRHMNRTVITTATTEGQRNLDQRAFRRGLALFSKRRFTFRGCARVVSIILPPPVANPLALFPAEDVAFGMLMRR